MTKSRRGDVLRAFDRLGADKDDHQLREDIARLLGMAWEPAARLGTGSPTTTAPLQRPVVPPPSTFRPSKGQEDQPHAKTTVDPPIDPVPEPFALARVKSPERRLPAWIDAALPMKPVDVAVVAAPSVPIPLLDPLQARAVLSGALARRLPDGPIDIERVVERIARGEAVVELLRANVPSIARGVQLLIDCGDGMVPYAADVVWIREALLHVVGAYALEVLQFAHSPLRGAGRKSRRTWLPYTDLTPPRRGATIIAVTDLGIRNLEPPAQPASVEEWVAFADHLDRLECPLLALVPYARSRVPSALRRRFAIVEWDRGTTAGRVRALIARGLP